MSSFKELADKKHEIYDEDLQAIVTDNMLGEEEMIKLVSLKVVMETGETPTAELTLSIDGEETPGKSEGDGPVDAVFKAIETLVSSGCELQLFSVNNITGGTDSQGEVTVRVNKDGHVINGRGSDTDIVAASAKAYINAINRAYSISNKIHPQV